MTKSSANKPMQRTVRRETVRRIDLSEVCGAVLRITHKSTHKEKLANQRWLRKEVDRFRNKFY